mgnify:CR=1 FL=1
MDSSIRLPPGESVYRVDFENIGKINTKVMVFLYRQEQDLSGQSVVIPVRSVDRERCCGRRWWRSFFPGISPSGPGRSRPVRTSDPELTCPIRIREPHCYSRLAPGVFPRDLVRLVRGADDVVMGPGVPTGDPVGTPVAAEDTHDSLSASIFDSKRVPFDRCRCIGRHGRYLPQRRSIGKSAVWL